MVKLLANENFPLKSILYLIERGYDVKSISLDNFGILDSEVMGMAILENRIILTFDRDYGELIFKHNYKPESGVVYLRIDEFDPIDPGILVEKLLVDTEVDLKRALTVIDGTGGLRQRRY